ncbi:hypothetical protein HYV79_03170 [Candidatus Woesearchaeota archaeon]|nr:hypothetical protein [Candidatus Woesearchaeota archaeon]
MVECISRISKGTKMDQIYLPKNRHGLLVGSYVIIKPLQTEDIKKERQYFVNIKSLEQIKLKIVDELFRELDKMIEKYDNIVITGSFLDEGFNFNDVDILLISNENVNVDVLSKKLETITGVKIHIILIDTETLLNGLSTDPLYQTMLSKCIAKKRFIYKIQPKIDYKILDFHLLKSKILIDNFDILDGSEKYYLTRNMIAILDYLKFKKVSRDKIDKDIKKLFNLESVELIKKNLLDKEIFLKTYSKTYDQTFNLIMSQIKNGTK